MEKILKLGQSDLVKGLVMAVLTPVVGYVYQIVNAGSFAFDFEKLGMLAISGLLGYLLKNVMTAENGKVLGKIG
jgi:hypothetical protein